MRASRYFQNTWVSRKKNNLVFSHIFNFIKYKLGCYVLFYKYKKKVILSFEHIK